MDRIVAHLALGLGILLTLGPAPARAEPTASLSLFAAQMSDNEWGDFFTDWDEMDTRNARAFGAGATWEWRLGPLGHAGIEANLLQWTGEQTHTELTVPLFARTPRAPQRWIPSLAYGLGLSYATRPSETEIARTGSSARLLAHWFLEAEFGNDRSAFRPYLRIHHRSDAWMTFDADTGSNALLLGLRIVPQNRRR